MGGGEAAVEREDDGSLLFVYAVKCDKVDALSRV